MPDTRLPELYLPDPNGFTNALAAGMKLRRYQDEGDAAARKEEDAIGQRNALSAYLSGDRSADSLRRLGGASPQAALAIEKSQGAAALNTAKTTKANAEGAKANLEALRQGIDAISSDPSRPNITMMADWLDGKGVDTGPMRKQVESTPDQALSGLVRGWTLKTKEAEELALKTLTADSQIKYRDSMLGKPMVVTQPGGTFALSPDTGYQPVQLDTGPSQMDAAAAAADRATESKRVAADEKRRTTAAVLAAKPPTAAQAKVGLLVGEADLADKTMKGLQDKGYDPTSLSATFDRLTEGRMTTNWLASSEGQTYTSAAREFVASVGYGKSGANLTESEWETGRQTYIPMPGDSKERLAFKAAARAKGLQGMHIQAGPAGQAHEAPAQAGPAAAPAEDERAELERLRALKAARGGP